MSHFGDTTKELVVANSMYIHVHYYVHFMYTHVHVQLCVCGYLSWGYNVSYVGAAEIVRSISLAVAHLHRMNIAHRDLKVYSTVCTLFMCIIVTALHGHCN